MVTQTAPTDQPPGPPRTGRPREGRIDAAVLRATADLLVESGYAELSLSAIADRAGTTRPALYRRWPSLAHLVHEAAFPDVLTTTLPQTGSLVEDVRMMVAGSLAAFSDPVARAAAPGLVAAIAADPDLHAALLQRFRTGALGGLEERLRAAVASGEASPTCDPGVVLDVIAGASFFALLLHPDDLNSIWVDRVTHLITEGIKP